MVYATGNVVNGKMVLSNVQQIDQSTLTSDCWMIQIQGAAACTTCKKLNNPHVCGGMKLREKLGVPAPIVRERKRQYVGILSGGSRERFSSTTTPTNKTHVYSAVIGPFHTIRGAEYMRKYGNGNPHLQCVADAERLAKIETGRMSYKLQDLKNHLASELNVLSMATQYHLSKR